jgi:hypothetical protein
MADIIMLIIEVDHSARYAAYVDDRYLITSAQPFLDGARTLIAQGYDPTRRMVMRREDREHYDLAALLGMAAGLTVESTRFGRPTFRPYRGQPGVESASPIHCIRRRASQRRQPTAEAA